MEKFICFLSIGTLGEIQYRRRLDLCFSYGLYETFLYLINTGACIGFKETPRGVFLHWKSQSFLSHVIFRKYAPGAFKKIITLHLCIDHYLGKVLLFARLFLVKTAPFFRVEVIFWKKNKDTNRNKIKQARFGFSGQKGGYAWEGGYTLGGYTPACLSSVVCHGGANTSSWIEYCEFLYYHIFTPL